MTSRERTCTVLSGGIPDRVPVCLPSFLHAARLAGLSAGDYCRSGARMAEAQLAYWEEFRHDVIDIENGVAAMAEAVGCTVEYSDTAAPWVVRPAIGNLDEIERLPAVDPLRSPALAELVKATRIVAGKVGDSICVRGQSDQGPFSLAAQIVGAETFMLALLDCEQTAKVHRLLEYAAHQIAGLARAQMAAGAHFTLIGDSIAGPDVCSPKLYRIFAQPSEKSLIDASRREGNEIGIHICGNASSIVGDMTDTGTLYIELDYKIDRIRVRAATGGRTTIFGTLDPHGLLVQGTPEEVMAVAREDIRLLGERGRFVLSPGCTMAPETPVPNVHAMLEAARQYGQYSRVGQALSPANGPPNDEG